MRLISGKVFHIDGRAPSPHSLRKPWTRAVRRVDLNPAPTIHDLRHVWKTNAMRSGTDHEIREAIVGHRTGRTMAERYGRISDNDLVKAIDRMTFDHGKTEILVGRPTRIHENHQQNTNKRALPEQSGGGSVSTPN